MAHRNAELVREGFSAFQRGDMEKLDEMFAEDASWHSSGNNPLAGDLQGKKEIFENFGRVQQLSDTFEQKIHDILANDDHAIALVNVKATREGKELDGNQVFVFHVENEKVKSVWLHNYDDRETDDFWN